MEISFTIDPNNLAKLYTGRSILPETLESFKEFKEIQRKKDNPYSRDNLICTQCEDKLSRLEAIFLSQFTNKKLAAAFNGNATSVGNNPVVFASYNLSLYELLIQSIFYRCSIGHLMRRIRW